MEETWILPGSEEIRMLRLIATGTLMEASRTGYSHATFHDFEFDAQRIGRPARRRHVRVQVRVRHHGEILSREVREVNALRALEGL